MRFISISLLILYLPLLTCYKFLVISPQLARSHVTFLAKLSDALVDAGHEVVILSQKISLNVPSAGPTKARIIEIPRTAKAAELDELNGIAVRSSWGNVKPLLMASVLMKLLPTMMELANETLHHPGLVEQLKAENFDAGFAEGLISTSFIMWHVVGIEKYAITQSLMSLDGFYEVTQSPAFPSYVPSMMGGYDDRMSFLQRVANLFAHFGYCFLYPALISGYDAVLEEYQPGFPRLLDIARNNSLVFLNSDPLLDFPRPTVHRVIDIGGITVNTEKTKAVDEYWSEVLNRRNKTILFSFGSFIKAYDMPDLYRDTIRETVAKFRDVTFIFKYERPEHNFSANIDNLVETTWMPQRELLHDPRLTAFITHGGQGSIVEASAAGTPLVCIALDNDQFHTAAIIRRHGLGPTLEKEDLGNSKKLENAIRSVLEDKSYAENAKHLAAIMRDRPFSPKDVFVRNMEFMVKHGPLRQFDHGGKDLNVFQFYLIDVAAFLILVVLLVVSLFVVAISAFIRFMHRKITAKKASEKLADPLEISPLQAKID